MSKHEQDTILRLADYLDGSGDYEGGIVEDRREEAAATLRTISAQLTAALARDAAMQKQLDHANNHIEGVAKDTHTILCGHDAEIAALREALITSTAALHAARQVVVSKAALIKIENAVAVARAALSVTP